MTRPNTFLPDGTRSKVPTGPEVRQCPAYPYCDRRIKGSLIFCQEHWFMLPANLRTAIHTKHRKVFQDLQDRSRVEDFRESIYRSVVWLHLALGPELSPENIAKRSMKWVDRGKPLEEAIRKAIAEGNDICKGGKTISADKSFLIYWKDFESKGYR